MCIIVAKNAGIPMPSTEILRNCFDNNPDGAGFMLAAKNSVYGFKGLMLMLLFYVTCPKWFLALPVMAAYMIWWGRLGGGYSLFGVTFGIQMFMLPALLPILIHTHSRIRINKWVFYLYYPTHLILIYLLDQFVF